MSIIKNFLEYIKEQQISENSDKLQDISNRFPTMLKLDTYVKYGNFGTLKKPLTDKEMLENEHLLKLAVIKFDELFKTNYHAKYGTDYTRFINDPNIKEIYYGDVVRQLVVNSFDINVYHNIFKYETKTIEDYVYKFIIFKLVNQNVTSLEQDFKKDIMKKIQKNINKKMFLYKFFKHFGKQFNPELIEEIFGINKKNMFELGGIDVKAEKTMQKVFLTILKQELDKYKDIINTDAVLDAVLINTLNYYDKEDGDLKSVIHDKYIIVKLKEFLLYLNDIMK